MLDIETMGNTSEAAIVAIAAVEFNLEGIGSHFYMKVDLESSIAEGLKMDASTVLWWLQQSDAARSNFKERSFHLQDVLIHFKFWLERNEDFETCHYWGNGAGFDNVILTNAFLKCGIELPWKHNQHRCFRTLKALFPSIEIPKNESKHDALADAKHQARYAILALRKLNN